MLMAEPKQSQGEYKVTGDQILKTVKEIVKAGNARKIIIKNDKNQVGK